MPRSGSTLQFQLTAHLVEQAGLGQRIEWVPPAEFPRLRERYDAAPGWKVFKTHICTEEVRALLDAHEAKGVYVYRDVRDAVVSRMRERHEPFAQVWQRGFIARVLTNFDRWTSTPGMLVSRYDEMVADVAGEVERIARHLGIPVDKDDCARVAAEYTIARQRARIRDVEARGALARSGDIAYDPVSNLHVHHIASGGHGEWRGVLSSEEVAMVEDRAKRWLVANGYPLALSAWRRAILKRRFERRLDRAAASTSRPRSERDVSDHGRQEADTAQRGVLPAIVLTCDRYHLFTAHMIARYEALWPSHPFTFQVPYQREPLRGPRITPRRTPEPIRATVLELLRERPDEQWVYWCIDDKYPLRLVQPVVTMIADAVRTGAPEDLDGILFCRARRMLQPDRLMPERREGPGGTWLLRRRDYSQMWIHQFFRVKVLRHVFERFPESVPSAGALDPLKYTIPLPADHRLYVVETNLAEFGESTIEGRVTANCAASLKAHGFEVPAALAEDQAGPLTIGTIAADADHES